MNCRLVRLSASVALACVVWGCGSDVSQTAGSADSGPNGGLEASLGLTEADGQRASLDALISGSGWPLIEAVAKGFKALPAEAKGDAIRTLALDIKSYFESADFAQAYASRRMEAKPVPTEHSGSVDDEIERLYAETRRSIAESRAELKGLPPELRAQVAAGLDANEAMLDDEQLRGYQRQSIEAQRAQDEVDDAERLQQWREQYPEDPAPLIARRLQDFLAVSADVDFGAKLVEADGKMKFADPDYERKPQEWKWCFRAGKATVEAAREVAAMWLEQL